MSEWREYHRDLWAQGKPVMAGTASILINLVQMTALRVPINLTLLSTILFWILIAITVGSFYWAAFLAWRTQHGRVQVCKQEADEMYADIVLDFLMQKHPRTFPANELANLMKWPEEKVIRGLRILQSEFQLVRDDGAIGWYFDAEKAITRGMSCNLRRLVPKNSN